MANRLNVQFDDRQTKALMRMAAEMGTNVAGVIKTACLLLEVTLRERKQGNSLGFIRGDNVVKEIINID